MKKLLSSIAAALIFGTPLAFAATDKLPLLLRDFQLHDFDKAIPPTLGYDGGAVIYFSEMGSITDNELHFRNQYEPVGCEAFYLMKDGKVADLGFNCKSFFCVGYQKGPKQCRDRDGNVYGGVAEINKRMGMPVTETERASFASFPVALQTPEMRGTVADLAGIGCSPFYTMHYDVIVGQGYECAELGRYPYFSPNTICTEDWKTGTGLQCTVPPRPDERERRLQAMELRGGRQMTVVAAAQESGIARSSSSAASVQSSVAAPQVPSVSFSDIEEGKYGFTAIITLAGQGIINGYPDGTFRPMLTVTRGELATLMFSGLYPDELQGETDCFPDVDDQWFSDAVCAGKRRGWLRGYTDGVFRPHRVMTVGEALTMLTAPLPPLDDLLQVELPEGVDPDAWYAPAVRKAVTMGIIKEPSFDPTRAATRADAAVWIYRMGGLMELTVSQK